MTPILLGTLTLATLALGGAFGALVTARIERRRRETDLDEAVLELLGDVEERLGALIGALPAGARPSLGPGGASLEDGDLEDAQAFESEDASELSAQPELLVDGELNEAPSIGELLARIDERIAGLERSTPWPEERLARALDALTHPAIPPHVGLASASVERAIESKPVPDIEPSAELEGAPFEDRTTESAPLAEADEAEAPTGVVLSDDDDADENVHAALLSEEPDVEVEAELDDVDVDALVASLLEQDESGEAPTVDALDANEVLDVETADLENPQTEAPELSVRDPRLESAEETETTEESQAAPHLAPIRADDPTVEANAELADDFVPTDFAPTDFAPTDSTPTHSNFEGTDAASTTERAETFEDVEAVGSAPTVHSDALEAAAPIATGPLSATDDVTIELDTELDTEPVAEVARHESDDLLDDAEPSGTGADDESAAALTLAAADEVDGEPTDATDRSTLGAERKEQDRAEQRATLDPDVEAAQGLFPPADSSTSANAPASATARTGATVEASSALAQERTARRSAAGEAHDAVTAVASLTRRLQIGGIDRATRERLLAELETALKRFRH
jgi:hypothetical protein